MEKNNNVFDGLIAMVQTAATEEGFKGIAVREYAGKFVYGEMKAGFIVKPYKLNITDKNSICQNLYDSLINEFGEQLIPGYSHDIVGNYEYFMTLGDRIMIQFPSGNEYRKWIYDRVQKDNEKQIEEKGKHR